MSMMNRKYYSFERNHYYYGKLLTSKDFEGEQRYMNDKRRFANRTLYGVGIVCGLNVVAVDDTSLVLHSGFAYDSRGREIVVPETKVMKLSTIEGYTELKGDCAYLGISYEETLTDPVYAVMGDAGAEEEKQQFNRVSEGYHLFLLDKEECTALKKPVDEYLHESMVYADGDIEILQTTPSFAVQGKKNKIRVDVKKRSHVPFDFSFRYEIGGTGIEEEHVEVRADNLSLEYGELFRLEYELTPQSYIFGNQDIRMLLKNIEIQKSGRKERIKEQKELMIQAVSGNVQEYILANSQRATMDVELEKKGDEKIWIAELRLLRSGTTVLIDHIEKAPMSQYVYNTSQLMLLERLKEFFEEQGAQLSKENVPGVVLASSDRQERTKPRTLSSGVFEMSLGNGGETGKCYFSNEIMHGLGSGAVYVEAGVEYLNKNARTKQEREEIILGDNSIFSVEDESIDEKLTPVDIAIKVLPDRGTFIAGIRPGGRTGKISVRIRWFAFKPEDLEQRIADRKDQTGCIMIQPDTIVLAPKGMVHINPVFINMQEEALVYTLLDPEGGKIDDSGVYTAPAQEGVYEVKAACISNPEIFTQAFIIVSQKKTEA